MNNIASLDALRGYAVLLVIWAHIPQVGDGFFSHVASKLNEILYSGYLGVELFFVLSGFLITRILLREKLNDRMSFKNFYIKRALRIFPIYYLTIVVVGFLMTWDNMTQIACYVSNYWFCFEKSPGPMRHTWSLAVEEHYYLIWPFLIYYFPVRLSKIMIIYLFPLLSIVTAILTVLLLDDKDTAQRLLYSGTNYQILSLAIGSYLAYVEKDLLNISVKRLVVMSVSCLFLLFCWKLVTYVDKNNLSALTSMFKPVIRMILFTGISVLVFIVFLNLNLSRRWYSRIIINRPIKSVGGISYGLYLYHLPVIYCLKLSHPQVNFSSISVYDFLLIVVTTFSLAILSFYFIERPILNYKRFFVSQAVVRS